MYFHFRSKHALALAIVEQRVYEATTSVQEVLDRKMSGLETLVDLTYLIATDDIGNETARAGLNLLESIGRTDGLQSDVLGQWVHAYTRVIDRAVGEGDVGNGTDPQALGRSWCPCTWVCARPATSTTLDASSATCRPRGRCCCPD